MNIDQIRSVEDRCMIPTYSKWPLALVKGDGSHVQDTDGHRYLDFYGGHCVCILGHCHPRVSAALQRQSQQLLFYSNVVYSDVRARASQLLSDLAPLKYSFLCNSGTEAIETALKIARKTTGRPIVVSTEGGFHGRTLGSLALTWNHRYREPFQDVLAPTEFAPFGDIAAMASILARHKGQVAAIVIEPIQSIAGIVEASDAYYQNLRKLCDEVGALLIFDEVQTGVGRTGTFSISEQYGLLPDMITLAKSLGAGVPIGAVLMNDILAAAIENGDQGSTFGGGMLAMAAMEACLQTIRDENLMTRATVIFEQIRQAALSTSGVVEVRGRGCLLGIRTTCASSQVIAELRKRHVLVGGSADAHIMRLMPPLTTTDSDIQEFATALKGAMQSIKPTPALA